MEDLLKNQRFAEVYRRLKNVSLNPRRHTAPDAQAHSDAVAQLARRLGLANGCTPNELQLLSNLGHAHDLGKITGTARPERSLEVLADCGVSDPELLTLVKWHDTGLPWHKAVLRGEAPSDKAWRRLAQDVDIRLLSIFMVADRVDAPGGWRRNAPTPWFLGEARRRGLIGALRFDVEDHPSEVCAGAALVVEDRGGPKVLVIRTRAAGWELPKGGLEWDELAPEAAIRELREEAGADGELQVATELGSLDYFLGTGHDRRRKRVGYFLVRAVADVKLGALPERTLERRWLTREVLADVPLVNDELRPILQAALGDKEQDG
jgi:8-oxo-dGTP pyrophosphatase MutT (NUDIX family)